MSGASAAEPARWTAVDAYTAELLVHEDEALRDALGASEAAGMPPIAVTPNQGKLLHLLVRMLGARSVLEMGTLGGYSTIWLARALPAGGRLVTLELDPHFAHVASENIEQAGVSDRVELRVGAAIDSLRDLAGEDAGPFDFTFIDADKKSMPEYFDWALELSHAGSVIVADNVVRGGSLLAPDGDATAEGIRRFHELLAAAPGATGTTIQTVGAKGWDGFTLILVGERG
jgi:predicted O-methyltransferase YrrM